MKDIIIYTDGACSGNPGKGSWAAILIHKSIEKEISGIEQFTTNNRMEMTAAIKALEILNKKCNIKLYTDSKYLQLGITNWIFNWQKNNWKNSQKKDVENRDLWEQLLENSQEHQIEWIWIKGHSTNAMNNRVDKICRDLLSS